MARSKSAPPSIRAPEPAGPSSVARVKDAWYVACRSDELTQRPLGRRIYDFPLVLFRDAQGAPAALLDRCAHRNVPLSGGKVVGSEVECPYHGWRFGADGGCSLVPALKEPQAKTSAASKGRRVPSFPVREQQGLVWVWPSETEAPRGAPYTVPAVDEPGYIRIDYTADFEATLHSTLENILDVPHTAFLHRGLFRAGERNPIEVVVTRWGDRVQAQYVGEPRPTGIVGRILAPGGGEVEHYDRFIMPSVGQVEYRLGRQHLVISNLLTPISDYLTRMYAVVAVRVPKAASVIKPVVMPIVRKILDQDAVILREQTATIKRFGREQFVSTSVDLLGPHILKLLRQAERGELDPEQDPVEERLEMLA